MKPSKFELTYLLIGLFAVFAITQSRVLWAQTMTNLGTLGGPIVPPLAFLLMAL